MAGWRVGFCCRQRARWSSALATIKGYYDYGMFQADPDRRDRRPAARRAGGRSPGRRCTRAAATCWSTACTGIGWDVDAAAGPACSSGRQSPSPGVSEMELDRLRHEAAGRRPTSPSAPAAASARPARATCGWRWSKTSTASGKPCGRFARCLNRESKLKGYGEKPKAASAQNDRLVIGACYVISAVYNPIQFLSAKQKEGTCSPQQVPSQLAVRMTLLALASEDPQP